jgi:nucleotide-binding universal stress UspA family protein
MFKNVVVGVDGRPMSYDAIALATRLTDPDGRITLTHVHAGELDPLSVLRRDAVPEESKASLERLEEARARAGVAAELASVVARSPGAGLHARAEEQDADLIVVGSCGRGRIGRAMLGDDTRAALNGAPCAVAVAVRGYASDPGQLKKIGVAYNDSPESKAALGAARSLAARTGAEIRALEVVALPTSSYTGLVVPAMVAELEGMVNDADRRLKALEGVRGRAVWGFIDEELAAFSQTVDLLIAGSRGYGPMRRLLLGSTTNYLERHARCSLLVLPRGVKAHQESGAVEERAGADPLATVVP